MSCFPCFGSKRSNGKRIDQASTAPVEQEMKKQRPAETLSTNSSTFEAPSAPSIPAGQKQPDIDVSKIKAKTYTFRELATATKNFRQECLLGEGGFGRVYKGTIQSSGQVVAVKQLDRNGVHGNKEFLAEVMALSLLHHPNIIHLIGYCADGDQRLLVHEFIQGGTLEDLVLDHQSGKVTLDWYTRIKIAYGTAQGLEYLHETANPPVVYRDFKSTNILLDEEHNPKLSDVGLSKLSNDGEGIYGPSRLMGAYGSCPPEYSRTGEVSNKSDVYSFGVILLELITGRRAVDTTRSNDEQNLVAWAQPFFKDPKRFPDMADHRLNKKFPEKDLNQAVAIAAMCLQEEAAVRPFMSDVVITLSFLSTSPPPGSTLDPAPDSGSDIYDDDEGNGEASDNESISSDNNQDDGAENKTESRDLRQESGVDSKEWHSFERDGSFSSGDQKSKSKRGKDQDTNEDGVSHSNNRVAQTEESAESSEGNSKSANFLDRATSRSESMKAPAIKA